MSDEQPNWLWQAGFDVGQLRVKEFERENQQLRASLKRCAVALNNLVKDDSPWPIDEVANKLIEAVQILLDDKCCDIHGHEQFAIARNYASLIPKATEFAREATSDPLVVEILKEKENESKIQMA